MTRGRTTGIIFIPLDVPFPEPRRSGRSIVPHLQVGMAAWYLYAAMACYCKEGLTDGFVPEEEVGALAYPLPPDQAGHLLKLLEEYRLISPSHSPGHSPGHDEGHSPGHDEGHSPGHDEGHSPGHDEGHSPGYIVAGYLKRNGTRLEALELAANLAKAGRAGASSRWSADQNGDGHSTGHSRGLRPRDAQTETETTSRARAPARPRAGRMDT